MYKKNLPAIMKATLRHAFLLMMLAFAIAGCSTVPKGFSSGWDHKEIVSGVKLSHKYFTSLFHAPENINMLDLNFSDTAIRIKIAYNDSLLETTSDFGKANRAIAAVNGNFFNTHIGGSVCFLKVNGRVVNRTHDELDGTLYLPWLDTAALAIGGKHVAIVTRPGGGWVNNHYNFLTIMSAGPLLIWNSKIVQQRARKFNNTRYSRTGIGLTKKHHLLIITVDGNFKELAGVSISEFAKIFKAFKCVSALNFDGGGSTTMWVSGEPGNGVVSHPTDNKKYDHFGERKVGNSVLIIKK